MPNGRPGDHPITDMLSHGRHPFPADMEEMIRRLHAKHWRITDEVAADAFDWEQGERLEEGRQKLCELCRKNGIAVIDEKKG
jgi:hypothetical protein